MLWVGSWHFAIEATLLYSDQLQNEHSSLRACCCHEIRLPTAHPTRRLINFICVNLSSHGWDARVGWGVKQAAKQSLWLPFPWSEGETSLPLTLWMKRGFSLPLALQWRCWRLGRFHNSASWLGPWGLIIQRKPQGLSFWHLDFRRELRGCWL